MSVWLLSNCLCVCVTSECPQCQCVFSLSKGGCLHFTCSQCQHQFCGGCSQTFSPGSVSLHLLCVLLQTCQLVCIMCTGYAFWPLITLVRIAALLVHILVHFAVRLFQFLCKFRSMKLILLLSHNNLRVTGVKSFWPIRALHFNTLAHLPLLQNAPRVQFNSVPQASQAGWITDPSAAVCCHYRCKQHWKGKHPTVLLTTRQSYHSSMSCVCVANSRLPITFPRIHYCRTQNCRLACDCGRTAFKKRFRNLKDFLAAIRKMAFPPHVQANVTSSCALHRVQDRH